MAFQRNALLHIPLLRLRCDDADQTRQQAESGEPCGMTQIIGLQVPGPGFIRVCFFLCHQLPQKLTHTYCMVSITNTMKPSLGFSPPFALPFGRQPCLQAPATLAANGRLYATTAMTPSSSRHRYLFLPRLLPSEVLPLLLRLRALKPSHSSEQISMSAV